MHDPRPSVEDLEQALRLDPRNAELLKNLGNALKASSDIDAAIGAYLRALEADPGFVPALYNLGLTLREAGRPWEAERYFRLAHRIDPRDGDVLAHWATLLFELGDFEGADPQLRAALRTAPENPLLWWFLGVALARRLRLDEGRECLERALRLEPGLHEARFHLGNVYSLLGAREHARDCYRFVHEAQPDDTVYANALLFESQHLCDWSELESLRERLRRQVLNGIGRPISPFCLLSVSSDRAEQLQCARRFSDSIRPAGGTAGHAPASLVSSQPAKLKIGYLSGDLHDHATAHLTAELFECHDRSRFEVFAYSYGPDDGSAMRERLRSAFDRFVDFRSRTDAECVAAIREDGVHILVDLKGHTLEARTEIVAARPAPVQVSFIGYPGTMGAPFIDYLVADRFVIPKAHVSDYSEKIVILPDSYQVNDRKRPLPKAQTRAALGLPEDAFVFCCFNQPYKILPDVFAAWMQLLRELPRAVLWLLDWNASATASLKRHAQRGGIDPQRLIFAPRLPRADHLARLPAADLFVDTFPYGAHTTASDALWMGLPVLACAGETFASRVAGSLLTAVELPELITTTMSQYRERAASLAGDPAALARLRGRLLANRSTAALFDASRFARYLESAYAAMWGAHARGEAPREIEIPR